MHMNGLLILGFVAQGLFGARFFVQWLASEKEKRSVVPFSFWILSLVGGILLFIYATARRDPVFMVGQASGVFIYIRNIYFIL
ncbi:MAG: lipid-A-disaccharide synthase N-terminal domain-containing protein, partial [Acetomicrobium sp.]|nr:lipid-A-disaccharide synthase N-terminal domain-containing protein [Acetomicrobium sp.]